MLNRLSAIVLFVLATGIVATVSLHQAQASGLYTHVNKARLALEEVENSDLREILKEWEQLYRFSAHFPDAFGSYEGNKIHNTNFLNIYAREIVEKCFPSDTRSCRHRQDLVCDSFRPDCQVRGSNVCSKDLSPCDSFLDCPGIGNTCADRGVCTGDYRTTCAQGVFNTGPTCPGLERCVDDYGRCISRTTDAQCRRLVTHFMGSLAHIVTDFNADKFMARTIQERTDCRPSRLVGNPGVNAQFYTDQELDSWLGWEKGKNLRRFLPDSRFEARGAVEDNFVDEVLLNMPPDPTGKAGFKPGTADKPPEYQSGDVTGVLNRQWFSFDRKTKEDGAFDLWRCTQQPRNCDLDDPALTNCKICSPGDLYPEGGNCDVVVDDNGNDGVCTGPVGENDYVTPCKDSPLFDDCKGLGNRCVTRYGRCELRPARREPRVEACEWAIADDHWRTEGGGMLDDAKEIAKLMDESYLLMQSEETPVFRRTGTYADGQLCVGTTSSDCLAAKTAAVIGSEEPESSESLDGRLSPWSEWTYVESIGAVQGRGALRFSVAGKRRDGRKSPETPDPVLIPAQVDCREPFDLNLDDEPIETTKLSNMLFTAMIEARRVQVRTDLARCSVGGRLLARNIRIEGGAGLVADAGPDQVLECTDSSGALAMLDGTGSDDPEGDPLTFSWTAPGIVFDDPTSPTPSATFPISTTTATLEVSDGIESDTDSVDIAVVDTLPPDLTCPSDIVIECNAAGGVEGSDPRIRAWLDGASAMDVCDEAPVLMNDAPAFFSLGDTLVTFTVSDASGNVAQCSATVTVEDTIAPDVSVSLQPDRLWPPNHKMVDITAVVEVSDVCDAMPTFVLTDVVSSEPDDAKGEGMGNGDGSTEGDIAGADLGTPDTSFKLRAERAGGQGGRTYTATYSASDASSNSSSTSAEAVVPDHQ